MSRKPMTPTEAARFYQLSVETIRRMCRKGDERMFRSVLIGRVWRIFPR